MKTRSLLIALVLLSGVMVAPAYAMHKWRLDPVETTKALFFSESNGQSSKVIMGHTVFRLECTSYSDQALGTQTEVVDIAPIFEEL